MKRKFFVLISLGFVLAVNLYFRAFPIYFPQLKTHAKKIVDSTIQQGAMSDVYKKFPQFYPLAKEEIRKFRAGEYQRSNKKAIAAQIQDLYLKLKDRYQDDSGQTYIMELDCWHWARYVKNVLKLGHPGDRVINSEQWDMYMLAPMGWKILWDDFFYYSSAFFYRVFSIFHKVPLYNFLFYLPLFFSALFVIVLYMVSYRYGRSLGAAITCLFVGLTPIFIPRSCAGWFKKDPLSMLFSVAILGSYVSALAASSPRRRFIWTLFSSFLVGLFAFTWTFWWFIFAIIIMHEILFLAYKGCVEVYIKKRAVRFLKERFLIFVSFVFLSFVWVVLLAGFGPVADLYSQIKLALVFNKPLMTSIWPNVFSTVGEMRKAGLNEIAHSIGGAQGMLLAAVSLICVFTLFIRSLFDKKYDDPKRASIGIILIWIASMAFATTRGVRFVMFLSPPLGIAFGWAAADIYYYLKKKNRIIGIAVAAIIFIASSTVFIKNGNSAAENCFPLMDDTWYKVLNLIKEKAPDDAIINSWWDFGDWFKVVADRRVIFDGQSQGVPQAYWMAKALLTDDENKAVSILRMLNNGGNEAFNIIDRNIKNPLMSALLLEGIMMTPPERAQDSLSKFLTPFDTEMVMKILFGTPSRACFVVDDSMPFKIGAISYLGDWDFSKVYIAQNFGKQEKGQIVQYLKNFGRDEEELQRFYQELFLISTKNLDEWLSRRLQFYSDVINGKEKDDIIYFENGFAYGPKDGILRSNSGQIPQSLFVMEGDNLVERRFDKPNVVFSLLIYKTESGYKIIVLDHELGASMLVRLYYLKGKGLKHFVPFIDAEEGDRYIRVFGIAW